MRAAEQGPKQESIQDWNIHSNLRLLGEIQRAQKKTKNQWALEKCYSFAAVGLGKNSCALRCLIRQNLRLSRMCQMKSDFPWSWIRYDWERSIRKMKGFSRSYLLTRTLSEYGWVGQFSGYVGSVNSAGQIPRIYAILRGCPRPLITDSNHEPLTEFIELKNLKWPSFSPSKLEKEKSCGNMK